MARCVDKTLCVLGGSSVYSVFLLYAAMFTARNAYFVYGIGNRGSLCCSFCALYKLSDL